MSQPKNPKWWPPENDSAWNRVKRRMKRDWNQIRHAVAGNMSYEKLEPAYRFGYGARLRYGRDYPDWDANFETHLAEDWRAITPARKQKWEQDRIAIRFGWEYGVVEDLEEDRKE